MTKGVPSVTITGKHFFPYSVQSKKNTSTHPQPSYTNYRFLTQSQMVSYIKQMRKEANMAKSSILALKAKIKVDTERNGVLPDSTTLTDFSTIMQECHQKILDQYSEDSFERLFWSSQLESI